MSIPWVLVLVAAAAVVGLWAGYGAGERSAIARAREAAADVAEARFRVIANGRCLLDVTPAWLERFRVFGFDVCGAVRFEYIPPGAKPMIAADGPRPRANWPQRRTTATAAPILLGPGSRA